MVIRIIITFSVSVEDPGLGSCCTIWGRAGCWTVWEGIWGGVAAALLLFALGSLIVYVRISESIDTGARGSLDTLQTLYNN